MAREAPCFAKTLFFSWLFSLLLVSCRGGVHTPAVTSIPPSATPLPPTSTPIPPSPTPVPLAALANGEPVTLAEYQAELSRFQAAQGDTGTKQAKEGKTRVLDDLIAQVLLAQAAAQAGFRLDETGLQKRIDALAAGLGGAQALNDWIAAHGYSETSFRQALRRAASAAWMRDKIVAAVPEKAEQIHARQILLYNSDTADGVLAQLRAGTDFATLAEKYDPVTGGDLGWFPRGILTQPALEQAVFALQKGQISQVIQTELGFHIVQVIEREEHPLDPGTRLALQEKALRDWLEQRRTESQIQVFLP